MAVGYTPGSNNASQFEEELAAVSARDQAAMMEATELEQMYAQDFNAAQAQERQSGRSGAMQNAQEGVKGLAKDELKRVIRKGGQKIAARAGVSAAGSGVAAAGTAAGATVGGVSLPVIAAVVIAIIIAIILFFIIVIGSIYFTCTQSGLKGLVINNIISPAAKFLGYVPLDICESMGFAINSTPTTIDDTLPTTTTPIDDGATVNNPGDARARLYLGSSYIPVNKKCVDDTKSFQQVSQTCLNTTRQATLDAVVNLKRDCDVWAFNQKRSFEVAAGRSVLGYVTPEEGRYCNLIVTGAAELGHAGGQCSHRAGYKIDLGSGSRNLNDYILSRSTRTGTRGGDPVYRDNTLNIEYVLEDDHWDITVNCP